VLHQAVRREGEEQQKRSLAPLAWSGLAAGLSKSFSLIGPGSAVGGIITFLVIVALTWLIGSAGFTHVVAGSIEVFFLAA
jgi:formate/nitrite transporter FocA (FNT family)